ncbi:hypothetical protein, partial [Nigerium sp.]|uniref:hypothetical protein n=1 Tax=Nigerium sp. TaxID=2042655 RepID=UPI003221E51E
MPRGVRAELRSLNAERAEIVGAHLLQAGKLIDSDPQLAYAHAEAARRRAARLPVVREATGEAAYAAGEYAAALNEFRALRRMSGGDEFLPAMADCERALGHPDKALRLVKEGLATSPEFPQRVELRLVEAGARQDLGQPDEALRLLRHELESSGGKGPRLTRVRLRYAYADLLARNGDDDGAERWFAAAAALDTEGETDAADRVAALQGLVLELDEDELDDDQDQDAESEDEPEPEQSEPEPEEDEPEPEQDDPEQDDEAQQDESEPEAA